MEKKLSLVLCFVLFLSFGIEAPVNSEGGEIGKFFYSVNDDNSATIDSYFNYYEDGKTLIIPNTLDGVPVKTIGANAIKGTEAETIYISEGIEIIEDDAFFVNFNLKELYIPSTVNSMGSIMACLNLERIIVDEKNPYLSVGEDGALYNKDKTELYWCPPSVKGTAVIVDGVKTVKKKAFLHCMELNTVVIGASVEKIEEEAFGWQKNNNLEVIFYNPNTEIIPHWREVNQHTITGTVITHTGSFTHVKTVYGYAGSTAEDVFTRKSTTGMKYPEVNFVPIIDVKINEIKMEFDTVPYIKNDRTMVPMRAIFEALGATVEWNDEAKTALACKGGVNVEISIGKDYMYVDGAKVELDCAAEIKNDRTTVPVRAISEAFGCAVEWNNETRTVEITY